MPGRSRGRALTTSATMAGMDTNVVDRPEAHRYEIIVDGVPAGFAAYRRDGALVSFTHTEVRPEFEGKGVGTALARGALEASRDAVAAFGWLPGPAGDTGAGTGVPVRLTRWASRTSSAGPDT